MAFNRYSLDLELSSSQYAFVSDNAALSITGDISIEAWIKLESLPSVSGTEYSIVTKFRSDNNEREYRFFIGTNDKLFFQGSSDGTAGDIQEISDNTIAVVGKWIHVACAIDVSTSGGALYVGGSSIASTSSGAGTSLRDGTSEFNIGARQSGASSHDRFFDGKLSNVRLWSDIRTEAEVQDNRFLVLTGTSNNLVGSWYNDTNDHNDDAGTNNLTASGSPVFSTNVPWTGANETDWPTREEIKIDNTKVSGSSDLTDFPSVLIDGNIPDSIYAALANDGKDLRLTTDITGEVEIPLEIVAIDTTAKTCEIHQKMPTVRYNTDEPLFLWAGNANAIAYDANAPFGSEAVWSDYNATWHLDEASGTRADSTANGETMSDNATVTSNPGKIGTAAQFTNATSEYLSHADNANLSTGDIDFELSQWIYLDNLTTSQKFLSKWDSDPQNEWFTQYDLGNDRLQFGVSNDGTAFGLGILANTLGSPSSGTWYYIVCRHYATANKITIQVNGGVEDESAEYTAGVFNSTAQFEMGRIQQGATNYLDGRMDEPRFIKALHSTDWTTTEYNNQNDPSTFWSAVVAARKPVMIF